jgi:hypothetical protein
MSALYSVTVDAIALSAATAKTLVELTAGAQDKARLVAWGVTFDGTNGTTTPAKVELLRASAAITGTSVTPAPYDSDEGAASATAAHSATAEGTATTVLESYRVPPTSGLIFQYPLGREVVVPKGGLIRVRVTAAAGVNATVTLVWEE